MRGFTAIAVLLALLRLTQAQKLQDGNTCKVVTFVPFTDSRLGPPEAHTVPGIDYYGYGTWPNAETLAKASFSLMAAAEMARRHFNERDTTIVSQLADLQQCDITMPDPGREDMVYLNSDYDRRFAVRQIQRHIEARVKSGNKTDGVLCAVVGPVDPFVAAGIAVFTEALRIPQIAYNTISYRLSEKDEYPTFARVIPEAYDFGSTLPKFFQRDIWKRGSAAILLDKTDYGEQFGGPMETFEGELGYVTVAARFAQRDDISIQEALTKVSETGFRTIVLITDRPSVLDDIARVADEMGLIGPGYFWILSNAVLPPAHLMGTLKYEVDSPADKLLHGAAIFTNYDRFVYMGDTDPFLLAWKSQNGSNVEMLNRMQPLDPRGAPFFVANDSYYQTEVPTEYASFIYDAVITAGISACKAQAANGTELRHIEQVFKTEFIGASGPVKFKRREDEDGTIEYANSRDPDGVMFGIYNVRRGEVDDNNMRSYGSVLTYIYSNENEYVGVDGVPEKGAWAPVEGTDFLFFDGTANEPMPRREVANAYYISKGIQITGFVLSGFAFFLATAVGIWVFANRTHRLIKASQPEFLYLLCFGSALVAPSAIFLSFDESKGLSEDQLSSLCSAFPWFFVIGYLTMYCALFSKLWRLSQLLQLRRKAVNIKQVILPFSIIIGCSFVVLVVWQVVDPFVWERVVVSVVDAPLETFGHCTSLENGILPFFLPLAFLTFLAVATTAVFSWKMRDVQSELAESRWIFAGIFLHIQTWLVGVPVFYITDEVSRDASYLMVVVLTFMFATSQVVLVIGPKIFVLLREKYFAGAPARKTRRISVMGGSTRVSGFSPSTGGTTMNSQEESTHANVCKQSGEVDRMKLENTQLTDKNEVLETRVKELETLLKGIQKRTKKGDRRKQALDALERIEC